VVANDGTDLVRQFWEGAFYDPDTFARMDDTFAADHALHDLAYDETRTLDDLKRIVSDVHTMLNGTRVVIDDQVVFGEGNVVTHLTVQFPAEYAANAAQVSEPTNASVDYKGITISRVSEGKIRESWLLWDAKRAAEEIVSPLDPWRWPPWR